MDVARLGLAVDSSQVEKGTVTLHQLTGAAGQAQAAANRLAGATQAEAAGHRAAAAATQAHNAALMAQSTVIRSSMQQRTMMIYQLNDIGVSLASGMNPALVAVQQGSQILQNGFAPALRTIIDLAKSFVVTWWPVGAAIGAAAAAVAGLTHEINKTAEVQVGFFDVVLAGWQLLSERIANAFQPLTDAAAGLWDSISPHIAATVNSIIGSFDLAFKDIVTIWTMLPAALGDVVYQGADATVNGVIYMVREVQVAINGFITDVNGMLHQMRSPISLPTMNLVGYADVSNPFKGANAAFEGQLAQNRYDVMNTDYIGAIGSRAQEIAAARKEADALGGAAKAANDNFKSLGSTMSEAAKAAKKEWDFYRQTFTGFFDDLRRGLADGQGLWGSFASAAANALDQISSRLLSMATNGLFDLLMGMFMPGFGQAGGTWGNGLWGSAIFNAKGGVYSSPSLSAFSGQIVNRPTMFAFAHGAGLMGEAGPEAIMPLKRGPSGRLGVEVANNNTPGATNSNGGTSTVRIELAEGLRASIIEEAQGNTIKIVQANEKNRKNYRQNGGN